VYTAAALELRDGDRARLEAPSVTRRRWRRSAASPGAPSGRCARASWPSGSTTDRLSTLVDIGVDEISWRKPHHYLTLVSDHGTGKIVWGPGNAGEGGSSLRGRPASGFQPDGGQVRCRLTAADGAEAS
jgi:hypothetical protein